MGFDEEDLRKEILSHLEMATTDRMADGVDPERARLDSLRDFGNLTLTTEAARDVWTPWWREAVQDRASDVRYAIRGLAKNPTFSLTIIAVLALGIGVNAAIFTVIKAFALTPLSGVERATQLAVVYLETSGGRELRVSYPDYQYLRDHDRAFSGLFGSSLTTASVGRGRDARQISLELVTGNYFQTLNVHAASGRTILPSDEVAPGRHPVIVLSDGFWRRNFGADTAIVGTTVEVNNYPLTVVGVADPAFHGTIVGYDVEAFVPVMMMSQLGLEGGVTPSPGTTVLSDRRAAVVFPHGFLQPGTTIASASAQTNALWAVLAQQRSVDDTTLHFKVVPFSQSPTGGQATMYPGLLLFAAMGVMILLIACSNITGLVLVRALSRRGEIAIRLALGASRTRIVRLLIVENIVLAIPATLLGVLLALRGIPLLVNWVDSVTAPQRMFFNSQPDRLLIWFAVTIACATALVVGLLPAIRSSRVDLVSVMNQDASPRGATRGRMRAALVVVQVAVSLLLLVGGGLVGRSVDRARHTDPGFDQSHVIAVALDLKHNGYDEGRGRTFYRRLLDDARTDVGIESASLAQYVPLGFLETRAQRVSLEGYQPRRDEEMAFMSNTISSDYFRTLRIDIVAGRDFSNRDDERAVPVAIVNRRLAEKYWSGPAGAIGKRIRIGNADWRTVVGVAADVKYARINEPRRPYFYLPLAQVYRPVMILHARGAAPVDRLLEQARVRIATIDPDLPIVSARPLAERTVFAILIFDFVATMLFAFGLAGMALSAMGVYGLVSYIVRQSTHEIGIRMALGASGFSIIQGFLARGIRLGAIGAALGVTAAIALTRFLGSLLFGVSPTDAASFGRALAFVLAGVIVATFIPAWRASRTNPIAALRHQ